MESEKETHNRGLGLGIKIFLLATNIFMVWLFIPINAILYAALVIFAISLFFLITGGIQALMSRKKRTVKVSPLARVVDTLGFARRYIRLNIRFTFLTMLGLMIAIATLSQSFIVAQGIQQDYVYERINPQFTPTLSVSTTIAPYSDLTTPPPTNSTSIVRGGVKELVYRASLEYGLSKPFRTVEAIKTTGLQILVNNTLMPVTLIGVEANTASELWGSEVGSLINKNSSEFVAVIYPQAFSDHINLLSNQPYTLYYNYKFIDVNGSNQLLLKVPIRIINVKEMDNDISLELPHNFGFAGGINLIYDISLFDVIRAQFSYGFQSILITSFYHHWDVLNANNIVEKLGQLADYVLLHGKEATKGIDYYYISSSVSPVGGALYTISEFLIAVQFIILIFILPMIGGALFLALYSFGLIENRKRKFIAILKSRGASTTQVATSLSLEILFSSLIGFILGILLAYGSTPFMIKFLGIKHTFTFSELIYNFKGIVFPVLFFSIVIGYDLNLNEILTLSPLSISEAEEPVEQEITGWKKYYVDVFMLLLGILGLIILEVLKSRQPSQLQTILMLVISPVTLIGISVGSVLAVSRYFGPLSKSVGDWSWIKLGNLPSFSLKNLHLRRETASGLASVLLLTTLIGVFLVIVPFSLQVGAERQLLYNLGGEIQVSQLSNWNASDFSFLHGDEGYEAVTGVYIIEFEIYLATSSVSQKVRLIGIDTKTFLKAAYIENSFLDFNKEDLSSLLKPLDPTHRVFPALIWSSDANEKLLSPGRSQTFTLTDKHQVTLSRDFVFKITGQFDYWPLLIDTVKQESGFRMVVPLNAIYSILDVIMPTMLDRSDPYLIAKAKPGYSIEKVGQNLLNTVAPYFSSPRVETILDTTQSQGSRAVLATVPKIVKMGYVVMLIQALIAVAMFASLTIASRKREIGLYKALGMLKSQLLVMFLTEILFILMFSLSLGTIFGIFASKTVMSVLSLPGLAGGLPPFPSVIPVEEIFKLLLAFIFSGLIAAVWPAQKLANAKTGDIMKVE